MKDNVITYLFILTVVLLMSSSKIKEGFMNLSMPMTIKAMSEATVASSTYAVPGTFQSALSPRFSNVSYGANILCNLPKDNKYLGTPVNPISYGHVKEGYCSNCQGACNQFNEPAQDANVTRLVNTIPSQQYSSLGSAPLALTNDLGETAEQPIIYDRLIYANAKSRLFSYGDPIRGDLAVIPAPVGWFRPSAQPQTDLRQGALMVMGGADLSTAKELQALRAASTANTMYTQDQTGIANNVNNVGMRNINALGARSDVMVTAFP
jgi:hypothetical protein